MGRFRHTVGSRVTIDRDKDYLNAERYPPVLESKFKLRPDQLGLRAGDEVRLRIVAYDGQTPSEDDVDMFATSSTDENAPIGKRGESIDIIVRVATPEMLGKN